AVTFVILSVSRRPPGFLSVLTSTCEYSKELLIHDEQDANVNVPGLHSLVSDVGMSFSYGSRGKYRHSNGSRGKYRHSKGTGVHDICVAAIREVKEGQEYRFNAMELESNILGWNTSLSLFGGTLRYRLAAGSSFSDGFAIGKSLGEVQNGHSELLNEAELAAAAEEKETHSFEVDPAQVD
ncbi:hypothetical protein C3L33_15619, partial [Rhododendron williamsianum]